MATLMWVCTGQYGYWIPCPQAPMQANSLGGGENTELLDGGRHIRRSPASARQYSMSWKGTNAELQPIKDLYEGLLGRGPFYFIDPGISINVLPPHWAAPTLATADGGWPTLMRNVTGVRSAATITAYGTPVTEGTWALPATAPAFTTLTPRILIPIPPGTTLSFKTWGGVTNTAVLRFNRYNRTTGAMTTQDVTPTATGASTTFSGATYSHVELWITKTSSAVSTILLAGLVATFGTMPSTWYSGEGNSGVQFDGQLENSTYAAWGSTRRSMSAQFVETGSWMQ